MENKFETAWAQLAETAKEFSQQSDSIARTARAAFEASKKGDLSSIENRIEDVSKAIQALSLNLSIFRSGAEDTKRETDSLQDFMKIAEEQIRTTFSDNVIYSIQNRLVVLPIVLTFNKSKRGIDIVIGDERIHSTKPSVILDFVRAELKRAFNAGQFVKSLYRAYESLARGHKNFAVSLEEIRQLLSISRDSLNSYSVESFTHDLQRLYSNGPLETATSKFEFLPAPAAKQQFPIYLPTGNFINVAHVRFENIENLGRKGESHEPAN